MNQRRTSHLIPREIKIVLLLILISIAVTLPLYYYRQSGRGEKTPEDVVTFVREELAKESDGDSYVILMEMTSNRNVLALLCIPDEPYYAEQSIEWQIWNRPYGFFDTYSLFKKGDFSGGTHHYRCPLNEKEEVLFSSNVGRVQELLIHGKEGTDTISVSSEDPFIYLLKSSDDYELVFEDGSILNRSEIPLIK